MKHAQAQLKRPLEVSIGTMRRWFRTVSVVTVIALLSFGAQRLLDPATLPITQVQVEGEFRHFAPEALETIISSEVRGGFFSIDVEKIRAALTSKPWVNDVTVRRVWPDKLQVTVFEHQPVAYWGAVALLSVEGVMFYPAIETFPEGLVQLDGPLGSERLVMERYRAVDKLLGRAGLQVIKLSMSEQRAWSFTLSDETQVLLGQSDFDVRLQRFAHAFRGFLGQRLHILTTVDLRYPNGFAVGRRGGVDDGNSV